MITPVVCSSSAEVRSDLATTPPAAEEPADPAATSLEDEVAWLIRVGQWFNDKPLVDIADRHLTAEQGTHDEAR